MWYDVVVLAILIVAMVRGAVRGVVWQLAGIAGIVLCLVFAETISAIGSPYVTLEPPLNQWVVMFVAYLFFSFLSFGFARLINGALEKAELKEYNKHLGAVFGLVKGVVLCLVITFFLVTLSERTRDMLKTSKSARYAAIIMDRLHPVMPNKLRDALAKYLRELDADDLDLKYATGGVPSRSGDSVDKPDGAPAWDPLGNAGDPGTPDGGGSTSGGWSQAASGQPTDGAVLDQLLRGLSNDYVRDGVREVYEAIPQQSRQRFLQELNDAGPALLFAVLQRWQAAPVPPTNNVGSTQNVGYTQPPAATRESLLSAIVGELARTLQERTEYEQFIAAGLAGLPDAVTLGVLQDWQADLTDGAADPDPQTSAATTLDQRIIRQLTVQRVSVYQLSQELRERLMQGHQQ